MSYNPNANYEISHHQQVKIQKRLNRTQRKAFHNAVLAYNQMTAYNQYAGDGVNGGSHDVRVDISVDPRRPVIHVEVDAIESGLFFRCEVEGNIVIQELAL